MSFPTYPRSVIPTRIFSISLVGIFVQVNVLSIVDKLSICGMPFSNLANIHPSYTSVCKKIAATIIVNISITVRLLLNNRIYAEVIIHKI
jgi:hypothetical protein